MRRRPRILMVSGHAPPVMDGVGDCTDRLLAELVRRRPDWSWVWLCKRPRWFESPVVRRGGMTLVRPVHRWGLLERMETAGIVWMLRPDLVHIQDQIHSFHETDAAVRIADAARSIGAPLITTLHEYHVELPSVRHTNELVARSDFLIANDPRNAERCRSAAGRTVDATWWSGATVRPPEPSTRPETRPGVVTTFGFLSALKSLEPVALALRRLRGEFPRLHWRIIGPFDPASNPHHAELKRVVGPEGVEFTGGFSVRDPKLRSLLAESELMILPFADGASERRSSLHVAWAFGLPVVTTAPPTEVSTIVDEDNCLLVRAATEEAWFTAIRRLLTDDTLADRLRAGSLRAADRFSWQRLADKHLEVYDGRLGVTKPSL
ncbi:MAG: hypothetical protein NVSMB9_36010 [Isosphaeraceae bacterium]